MNRRLSSSLVTLAASIALACGGSTPPASGPAGGGPCADFQLDVERVWSASVKAEILGKGGAIEASKREAITTKLDQLSDDWVRLRTSTCRDHFDRKLLTGDEYKKRVRCFDDRLDQQRRLVALTRANDGAAAETLAAKLAETPDACR
jgi:hypothetical protein